MRFQTPKLEDGLFFDFFGKFQIVVFELDYDRTMESLLKIFYGVSFLDLGFPKSRLNNCVFQK